MGLQRCVQVMQSNLLKVNKGLLLAGVYPAWQSAFQYALEHCSRGEGLYNLLPKFLPKQEQPMLHDLCSKVCSTPVRSYKAQKWSS